MSQIDEVNNSLELIYRWTGGKKFDLCYKATQHGFDVNLLHEHIVGKSPSIIFIKTEFNKVFGAYCSIPWSSEGNWLEDPESFVFSLSEKAKHE